MVNSTITRVFHRRKFKKILALFLLFTVVITIMIIPIEREAGGNITNLEEATWWSVTTLSTVGYGDFVPISAAGRFLGGLLQIVGVVMFGLLIAMVGAAMDRNNEEFQWKRNWERLDRIEKMLEKIDKENEFLIKKDQSPPHKA